jgi:hypothetical protein
MIPLKRYALETTKGRRTTWAASKKEAKAKAVSCGYVVLSVTLAKSLLEEHEKNRMR